MWSNLRIPIKLLSKFSSPIKQPTVVFKFRYHKNKSFVMDAIPEDDTAARLKLKSITVGNGIHTDIYERVTENKSHNIKIVIVPGILQ